MGNVFAPSAGDNSNRTGSGFGRRATADDCGIRRWEPAGADDRNRRRVSKADSHPGSATFGPSGLLRERIEKGERPDVFASADLSSPQKLVEQRLGTKVEAFTANSVCVIARPDLHVDASNLLDVVLDPKIAIGTSTPEANPLGDYTEAVFSKADKLRPGSQKILDAKARRLTGGKDSPRVHAGKDATGYFLLVSKQADLMLTYCSGVAATLHNEPTLRAIHVPENLSVPVWLHDPEKC